jgi:protoporphyrinogen oxidase
MTRVAILGGGYAGLGAALRLGELGIRSTLFEAAGTLGGLGGTALVGGIPVERFYHHIKPEDVHVLDLAQRLGLGDRLRWVDTRMGFLSGGSLHPFSSPLDLLLFRPFSTVDKVRFAMGVLKAKRTDGAGLTEQDAESWIIREWGRSVYERMMRQMLLNKFGIEPREISAAFLHGRIKGLSSSKSSFKGGERFAYLEGSVAPLTERLVAEVGRYADVRAGTPVTSLSRRGGGFRIETPTGGCDADVIINTLALTAFEGIKRDFPFDHSIRYQGAINGIFVVRQKVTPLYWINILDPEISFRVLVNQSALGSYQHTVLYCGNYVAPSAEMFQKSDDELAKIYRRDLEKIFGPLDIIDHGIFRTPVATPIFDREYGRRVSDLDQKVPNMIFAGNVKIYPGTRTLSSVFRTGLEAAEQVTEQVSLPRAA